MKEDPSIQTNELAIEAQVPESTITAVRRLYAKRMPLNITAVRRHSPALLDEVYALMPFAGWKRTLAAAGIAYSNINIELFDTCQCQLCGQFYSFLVTHLLHKHSITPAEYQDEFPGAEIMSEAQRARSSKLVCQALPHWEPIWSPEYLLDRINEFHRRGFKMNMKAAEKNDRAFPHFAKQYFGSWDEAIRKIGVEPEANRLAATPSPLSKKEIIEAIRLRQCTNLPINARSLIRADGHLFDWTLQRFGSYDAALSATAIDPLSIRRRGKRVRLNRLPGFESLPIRHKP